MIKVLRSLGSAGLIALLAVSAGAQTKQPFEATATTTDTGPNITLSAAGNNLSDFVSSLINTSGQFSLLNNRSYFASSTFLGVKDAITYNTIIGTTGVSVTYALKPINFTKTFTGPNKNDVENQIDDFFKKNGAQTIADFLAAIAKQSTIAVTDGNPNAATAIGANNTFTNQGFTPADQLADSLDSTSAGATAAAAKPRFGGFGIGFNAGHFKAGGFEGDNYDFSFSGLNIGLGDSVRLLTPVYANYVKVSGAQIGGVGGTIALPITVHLMSKDNPWNWRITPSAGLGARVSVDLAGGAALWQAGISNTLDFKVAPKLVVGVVNQISEHKSIAIDQGDFHFDPKIDQQILKNGLRLVAPLTRRVIADFFVIDTRFLKDASVKSFQTYGGSLSLRATPSFNLSLGGNYDTGTNFEAYSVGLSSAWRW